MVYLSRRSKTKAETTDEHRCNTDHRAESLKENRRHGYWQASETVLPRGCMKTKPNTNTHASTETPNVIKAKRIMLDIDVHADSYRVVRQMDHATPQPAQKFTPSEFLLWAKKQLTQAEAIHSCYEAGPLGYSLHRALAALEIQNVVVRPQNWDELHKGVKTDKTDAMALVQRLGSYVDGNMKALSVVRGRPRNRNWPAAKAGCANSCCRTGCASRRKAGACCCLTACGSRAASGRTVPGSNSTARCRRHCWSCWA
jgi:hypothetical protein